LILLNIRGYNNYHDTLLFRITKLLWVVQFALGVPDLIFPLGFDEKGDPLVVDNVGRQLTVRLKENDVPIWKRKVSIEEARLHARAGEEYPSWFFGVPMTREAKGYTKGPFINNEMFIVKDIAGTFNS